MVPRLRETRPADKGSYATGITQPQVHYLAHPCTEDDEIVEVRKSIIIYASKLEC